MNYLPTDSHQYVDDPYCSACHWVEILGSFYVPTPAKFLHIFACFLNSDIIAGFERNFAGVLHHKSLYACTYLHVPSLKSMVLIALQKQVMGDKHTD